ncbi:MAG: ABC transporter ATP-binding protein [Euzebyaceae bacterium]|nr:ABC transporter ATP-binding protein [Euzebyaceae bacterium]
MLEVRGLSAHYGVIHALQGVDLDVGGEQVVALFGRNGVGKTTLVSAVMGMLRPTSGSVRFDGRELAGAPPHVIARAGIGLVPQGRRVFAALTVEENLGIAARAAAGDRAWTRERVYDLLPRLADRRRNRGHQLSGGEQQMLAIGRALLGNPRLLLLDEPSDGLAPRIVDDIVEVLAELRAEGIPALLVEQNLGMALRLADVVAIMTKGQIVYRATAAEFRADPETARTLLGVA